MRIVDSIIAFRVLWILITPIENTDAFKLGLINADGKTIKKAKTAEESNATSPLHRMVWNLKRIIGMVPGGSTRIGSLAAGYLLMKEAIKHNWSEDQLAERVNTEFATLCEQNKNNAEVAELLNGLIRLNEDAPTNSSSSDAGDSKVSTDVPTKKMAFVRRQNKKIIIKKLFENKLD